MGGTAYGKPEQWGERGILIRAEEVGERSQSDSLVRYRRSRTRALSGQSNFNVVCFMN